MSASRASRSYLALNVALSLARGLPFFRWKASPRRASGYWRWGKSGRLVASSSGSVAHLPDLNQQTINQFGDVLLAFPNGFCLDVEGKVIPRLDIASLGNDLARRDEDAGGKVIGFRDLVNQLPEKGVNQVERVLQSGYPAGTVHDLPFVIVVLPRSEAYSRFPEIAPSPAKDGE